MKIPDFPTWNTAGVSPRNLAAAIAAAGVLYAYRRTYPFGGDENGLRQDLTAAFRQADPVRWDEPDFLSRPSPDHPPAAVFAAAWDAAMKSRYQTVRLALRVETEHAGWYFGQFAELGDSVHGWYVEFEPPSPHLDWNWPLRVGIVGDAPDRGFTAALEGLVDKEGHWLKPLLRFVDVRQPDAVVDCLFVVQASDVLRVVRSVRYPVLANVVVVFGLDPARWAANEDAIRRGVRLLQAKGIVLTPFGASDGLAWFVDLVRQVSHNCPVDVAVRNANLALGVPAAAIYLAASPVLLRAMRLEAFAENLVRALPEHTGMVELDEHMSGHVGLPPVRHSHALRDVGRLLDESRPRFRYAQESDEATTLSRIAESAKAQGMPRPAHRPEPRRLQHQLTTADPRLPVPDRGPLVAGQVYELAVRIGPTEAGWGEAAVAFPEQELPTAEGGHVLTVVFSEPHSLPEPQVETIFLPRNGASSTCTFSFTPKAAPDWFEGRLIVLHANRVMQTALLRMPVKPAGTAETTLRDAAKGGAGFQVEATVRGFDAGGGYCPAEPPPSGGAGEGRPAEYGPALILNHTTDGEARATRVTALRASTITLVGVEAIVENIKLTWDAADWESPRKFRKYDAPEVAVLLGNLAVQGRLLYDAIVEDGEHDDAVLRERRLQVVAARPEAHLPIEFCYSRQPPEYGHPAPFCPHARTILAALAAGDAAGPPGGGAVPAGCPGPTCPVADDGKVICPLAFWGLSRVIEWHRFDHPDGAAPRAGDFEVRSDPTPRERRLKPLTSVLLGASELIPNDALDTLRARIAALALPAPKSVASWAAWKQAVAETGPSLLVLMVHVQKTRPRTALELKADLMDYVYPAHVQKPDGCQPVVLLLGCGTGVMEIPSQSFTAQFRRKGAAIVVSTIAELLDVHAPRLAERIVTELAKPSASGRTWGDLMLAVKRRSLLEGEPIALALLSYGDADWTL
ncbi:MAG TPA: hypothetical protein VHE61_21715 [Opitutaceae bacterium]|nr:hypothetical protein [Opitutaceae bacterium]